MSNLELTAHYDETSRPYYAWDEACELTRHLSQLALPYKIVTACGAKAVAMVAEMQGRGVDPIALGMARSYIPDLSAKGIQRAYDRGESMHTLPYTASSFSERLSLCVGEVDMATKSVEFAGIRLFQKRITDIDVTVVERTALESEDSWEDSFIDARRWELLPSGEKLLFCNHTAATIRTLDRMGQVMTAVVDPSYDITEPLDMQAWKEQQNFSDAIILSSKIIDDDVPLHVHTELMTDKQLNSFRLLVKEQGVTPPESLKPLPELFNAQPELYKKVLTRFLDLQSESTSEKSKNPDHYDYALHLAKTVLTGKEYNLPQDTKGSREKVREILGKLAPVMAYQNWIEKTDELSSSRGSSL